MMRGIRSFIWRKGRRLPGPEHIEPVRVAQITGSGYVMDGGSVLIRFVDADGTKHDLLAVQDFWDHGVDWERGAIVLDDIVVDDEKCLSRLLDTLRTFDNPERLERNRVPLPENTLILGDDITDYMTRDAEGGEQWLLTEAIARIERALGDIQT